MARERKRVFNTIEQPITPPYDPVLSGKKFAEQSPRKLSMGFGSKVWRADERGIWLGAEQFEDAPFRVSMEGLINAVGAVLQGKLVTGASGARVEVDPEYTDANGTTPAVVFYDSNGAVVGILWSQSGTVVLGSSLAPGSGGFSLQGGDIQVFGAEGGESTLSAYDSPTVYAEVNLSSSTATITCRSGADTQTITITPTTTTFSDNVVITGTLDTVGDILGSITVQEDVFCRDVVADGDLYAGGTKFFDIEHPTKEGMRLRYSTVESPEVLVMCRGTADTEEEIDYPQHFLDVCDQDTIVCQVGKLRGSNRVAWFATAVRKGYEDFEPEYEKQGA